MRLVCHFQRGPVFVSSSLLLAARPVHVRFQRLGATEARFMHAVCFHNAEILYHPLMILYYMYSDFPTRPHEHLDHGGEAAGGARVYKKFISKKSSCSWSDGIASHFFYFIVVFDRLLPAAGVVGTVIDSDKSTQVICRALFPQCV